MIVNVRGSHGSGKSHTVRAVMDKLGGPAADARPTEDRDGFYLRARPQTWVMGRYGAAGTGGVDTIKDILDVERIIYDRARDSHVLMEGIRVNSVYSRWLDMALGRDGYEKRRFLEPNLWHMVFLDVTLERCFGNVLARRKLVGDRRPLSETNRESIADQHNRALRHRAFFKAAGFNVHICQPKEAVETIVGLLKRRVSR